MGDIEPVVRVNLTSQVIGSIKSYISNNNLQAGDRLPSERELTKRLGVSRNILREALKSLEAIGLIEIKVGDGMYVSDFSYSSMVDHLTFALFRNSQDLQHLIQARLLVEVASLDIVAGRITPGDLERLGQLNVRIQQAPSADDAVSADLAFHRALLKLTGNPFLYEFCTFLVRFFMKAQEIGDPASGYVTEGHTALLAALQKKDVALAKQTMRNHILHSAVAGRLGMMPADEEPSEG